MKLLFWLSILFIVYVYVGYPLLIGLLAKLYKKGRSFAEQTPPITLLIAAYNEEDVIGDRIENALSLDYPTDKLQILVAADGSSDKTIDVVESFSAEGVALSYSPQRRGKLAAINNAIPKATGDIIIFSDANNWYETMALRDLVRPFSDPQVGAVCGAKRVLKGDSSVGDSEGLYWKYESFIKKSETAVSSCTGAVGEIWGMRKSLYEYPKPTIICDDFYMATRVTHNGYDNIYVPTALSMERVSLSAQDELERRTKIVAGRYQAMTMSRELLNWKRPLIVWQILSHKFARPLVPLAMLVALVVNFLAILLPSARAAWLLAPVWFGLQLAFYTVAIIGSLFEGQGKLGKLLYLPTFLVNSNLAALVGGYRFFTGKQTVLWRRVARRQGTIGKR